MMLFAIVFGLSMDYEVFLLSRMKEEYDRTSDNATAVADGLAATARVITAAALIMVCVFSAFVLGDDRSLKLFGLGLAVAVLVDATIVRMILVPATMELLGDRNWWLPEVARPDPAEGPHRGQARAGAAGSAGEREGARRAPRLTRGSHPTEVPFRRPQGRRNASSRRISRYSSCPIASRISSTCVACANMARSLRSSRSPSMSS